MRRIMKFIIIIFMFALFPLKTLARGDIKVSTTSLNIEKGSTATFEVTADYSAGRIDVSNSNPGVISVSESTLFLDMQSGTVTVKGNSVGSDIIKIYAYDVTSYDDEDLSGKTITIKVNVTEPEKKKEEVNKEEVKKELSKNNKLKSIEVEGFEIEKTDNESYLLSVANNVTSVNIKAIAEDSKSKINGDGIREINVGENDLEIVVIAESGLERKYKIKVIRKDSYYIEDIEYLLETLEQKEFDVKINEDSIVTEEILKKIEEKEKKVNFSYYNKERLIYSWIIDGKNIENAKEFLTTVSYITEYKEEIEKLSNNEEGIYVNIKEKNNLPIGVKLKIHVGDKFPNENNVKLYCYDNKNNNLEVIENNLKVNDKYIEYEVKKCSEYFITKINVEQEETEKNNFGIFIIIGIIIFIIMLFITIYLFNKRKRKNIIGEENISVIENSIISNNIQNENNMANNDVRDENITVNNNIQFENNIQNENNIISNNIPNENNMANNDVHDENNINFVSDNINNN